jgi:hypothetical protein
MTDRVEIKPDSNEKTLEQSAEDLKKNDGVDVSKDTAVNQDGEGATIRDIKQEDLQTSSEERPEWLPEKFKNAEELSKAYTELEKQYSGRKEETKPEDIAQEVQDKGLDKFYNEYAETGELTENSYTELAKQGLDRKLVDTYIDGQKLVADTQTKSIQEVAGGTEKYNELVSWAGNNLSEAEQKVFNDMVDSGDVETAKFAVQGLMNKANVKSTTQSELFEGTSDVVSADAYTSVSQVTDAMNDPRYEKDPSYRKEVENKISRSKVI